MFLWTIVQADRFKMRVFSKSQASISYLQKRKSNFCAKIALPGRIHYFSRPSSNRHAIALRLGCICP
jgi:hypothetical protein